MVLVLMHLGEVVQKERKKKKGGMYPCPPFAVALPVILARVLVVVAVVVLPWFG